MITFLGDVFLKKAYNVDVDYKNIIFNLEYTLVSDNAFPVEGKINLGVKNDYIPECFNSNVLSVCLANNHVFDYGENGFQNTLNSLACDGIGSFGVKKNNGDSYYFGSIDGVAFALLGYCCRSTNPYVLENSIYNINIIDIELIKSDIADAKRNGAQKIFVSMHWGDEEVSVPKPCDISIARQVIDCGADLIVGHHAHRQQGYEKYKGKYIFYGLGNCIFPDFTAGRDYSFDSNEFSGFYIKKQKKWNKQSYAVGYDLKNDRVTVDILNFDGKKLSKIKDNVKAISLHRKCLSEKRYIRSKRLSILHNSFLNYIANPKILTPKKIISFVKSL